VPALAENKVFIDLAIAKIPAKPTALQELGVPLTETSLIKKGKLNEFIQTLEDGKIGRRFQAITVTAIKASQGPIAAKVFVDFEVFSDENVPEVAGCGYGALLYAGTESLLSLPTGSMFFPYASTWYTNHYVFDIPGDVFDKLDKFEFVAKADTVVGM
jgi:hypothetical protein